MSDLISRQAAIDEIMALIEEPDDDFNEGVRTSASVISKLPSAQPQRKKRKRGHWIGERGTKATLDEFGDVPYSVHCSECGDWLTGSDEYACRGRYCPSCGADMRGESDEN